MSGLAGSGMFDLARRGRALREIRRLPRARSSSPSEGRSATDVSLPNCPIAPASAAVPRSSCPRQKLSAACRLKAAIIEQDLAVNGERGSAPLQRFLGLGNGGMNPLSDLFDDRARERLRLGNVAVDPGIAAFK